jgi:hypothetical protein
MVMLGLPFGPDDGATKRRIGSSSNEYASVMHAAQRHGVASTDNDTLVEPLNDNLKYAPGLMAVARVSVTCQFEGEKKNPLFKGPTNIDVVVAAEDATTIITKATIPNRIIVL